METLHTLLGKYGDEGDKLLFKVLNSGDYLKGISDEELQSRDTLRLQTKLCEKGLRYDLTVPFARYVVMHRDELQLPFKRYQIQPVWRADRPQKGRYREFYQCDADVVGSDSLLNEVELMQIVDTVFTRFGVRICIKINNRKILTGIAEVIGEADKIEFKTSGKVIKSPGWKVIFQQINAQEEHNEENPEKEEEHTLPAFVKGESGPHSPMLNEKWTQPPRPYTEATLPWRPPANSSTTRNFAMP